MQFTTLFIVQLASLLAKALPLSPSPDASQSTQYQSEIKKWFNDHRTKLNIKATTVSPLNQTIDWIPIESQGKIAQPPPARSIKLAPGRKHAVPELHLNGAKFGPKGTVPILKKNLAGINYNEPLSKFLSKESAGNPLHKKAKVTRADEGHHYGSTGQTINNFGTCGTLNFYDPYVETTGDFSLLQDGVFNGDQTMESGWQKYQGLYGDDNAHLFIYYTTDGYTSSGDNIGGYNRDVQGWVQVSDSVFPGTALGDPSEYGGAQTVISICSQFFQGNWWLNFQGEWIGYYPGSMYAANSANGNLGNGGTGLGWWGEVYDDGSNSQGTTTDMGNGHFPGDNPAFMETLRVLTDENGDYIDYVGDGIVVDVPQFYGLETHWQSGTDSGSYAFVGGPGSG